MIIEVYSVQEMMRLAENLAEKAKEGQIYCLVGDLGVGKTVFTKGFAKGLGIVEDITSPTFTIVNEYNSSKAPFYHFDVYRLNSADEFYDVGFEEYFYSNGICLIEWADMIPEFIPNDAIWIKIEKDLSKQEDYRIIEVDHENTCN